MRYFNKQLGLICAMAVLIAALLCAPAASGAEQTYEGPGSATPEEAVMLYLEGFGEQNIDKMISAYAVESYIDHFDFEAQLLRISAYTIAMTPRFPNSGPMLQDINVEVRKNEIVQSVLYQMTSLCMPGVDFSRPIAFSGEQREQEVKTFTRDMEGAFAAVDFSTLQGRSFLDPAALSEHYASEQNQKNLIAQYAPFAPDEVQSMVALFTVDEKVGALCCDVLRYGDKWYMGKPGGNIGALLSLSPYTSGMVAVDREAFMALRDQLGEEERVMLDSFLPDLLPNYKR